MPIQTFFWSANCTFLVCKLCLLLQIILDLWSVLILEIFSSWNIKTGQFQFLVTFFSIFFWSVNCTSGLEIRSAYHRIFWTWFTWGFLVFSFLVFSVFKYIKFTLSSSFSWSWNVEVLVCKLYMQNFIRKILYAKFTVNDPIAEKKNSAKLPGVCPANG